VEFIAINECEPASTKSDRNLYSFAAKGYWTETTAWVSAVSVPVLSKTKQSTFDDSSNPTGFEQIASDSSRSIDAQARAEADSNTGKSDGTEATATLVHYDG
jgi:hypothetical protein